MIEGFEQLHRRLVELSMLEKGGKKVARKAMNQSASVIAKVYRKASPVGPVTRGTRKLWRRHGIVKERQGVPMKQSVGKSVFTTGDKNNSIGYKVGFNVGKKTKNKRAPHAHLYVLGTVPRAQKTTGKYVGYVTPHREVKAAVASSVPQAVSVLANGLKELTT